MENTPKIVVTIPAYNEEETIGDIIGNINRILHHYNHEIQIIDDGSVDRTADIARSLNARVISHRGNFGLAETFRDEIRVAILNEADIIVHIDADGQYLPEEIPGLIDPIIQDKADLVLGSRFGGNIEYMPWVKKVGNTLFSKVVSNIAGLHITDAQTGFRAFSKEVAKEVTIRSRYTYTQEQIIRSAWQKFRIIEVPVVFSKRNYGTSRLMSNSLEYAIRGNVNLLRIYRDYAPLKFFGSAGVLIIVLAFLLFLYSSLILQRTMDITVIFLAISGVQILLFGFLADMIDQRY